MFGLAVGFLSTFGCGDDDNNHAPTLHILGDEMVYEVYETEDLYIAVAASDPDGDALSLEVINSPTGAVFNDPGGCGIKNFEWTPTHGQAGNYEVTFEVSDGQLSDSETITITVNKAKDAGAAFTGIYPATAYNFLTWFEKDGFNCADGIPAPGCEWFPLFIVQNDEIILVSIGELIYYTGTIYYDGNFGAVDDSGIGIISDEKIEGFVFYSTPTHAWSFEFIAPIPATNVTVTVEGFTGHDGKHVYTFVDAEMLAIGGSEIVDGSAIIQPIPELPDGPYTILVVVDTDGNIEESLMGGIGPTSVGDWVANEILTISEGSGKAILNKSDHFEEVK